MAGRVTIQVRLSPTSLEWLEAVALEMGVPRSVVLRAVLAVGTQHRSEVKNRIKERV